MAEATKLNAVLRATESNGKSGGGKGNARATRRAGNVPAVIYGNNEAPILIALDINKLTPVIMRGGFLTHTLELELDGKNHHVLPRDVQFDPVRDVPLHVDFLRVTDRTEIRVEIPVTVLNGTTAPGVKEDNGVVNLVAHQISFYARAGQIPEAIEVDVGALKLNESIHLSDVTLPKGLRLINPAEGKRTIVTIGVQAAEEAAPAPVEAPAAPAKGAKGGKAAPAAAAAAPAAAAKPAAKKK